MKLPISCLLFCLISATLFAQPAAPGEPYYEIPTAPEKFTAATVAARTIDGLGFRYYWASEGLRPEDLKYKPGNDTRTAEETLKHIYSLTLFIANTAKKTATQMPIKADFPYEELRKKTLENIKAAADILRTATDAELNDMKVVFKTEQGSRELPFWNILNGPIGDALWHTGQVVSFRRASGNPFNAKASVLMGKFNP